MLFRILYATSTVYTSKYGACIDGYHSFTLLNPYNFSSPDQDISAFLPRRHCLKQQDRQPYCAENIAGTASGIISSAVMPKVLQPNLHVHKTVSSKLVGMSIHTIVPNVMEFFKRQEISSFIITEYYSFVNNKSKYNLR